MSNRSPSRSHRFALPLAVASLVSVILIFIPTPAVIAACPPSFPVTIAASDTTGLIEAIECANATTSNDVINLTPASTYTLTTTFLADNGLPRINDTVSAGTLIINGNGATIARSSTVGTPEFRLLILDNGANLTINNLRLTNGLVSTSRGAAIANNGGTLTVNASAIQANSASRGAGIFSDVNSITTLRDSTLSNNTAGEYGSAIENNRATLNIINSTISGNTVTNSGSNRGGAIGIYGASAVTITNSTITNNTTPAPTAQRSGIWQEAGTLTIRNSIVANNNGANNCSFTGGTRNVASNNLDNGTSCGFSGTVGQNTNPLLGTLDSNGGLTQTHALLPGSPAMNAGDNTKAVDQNGAALTTDQRGTGYSRILGATVDIGAYESACTGSLYSIPASNATLLIEAIKCANATASNDVINLAPASTYTLTAEYSNNTGLPPIVAAGTAGTLTINGNGATITRALGNAFFRIFTIYPLADLTLNQLSITHGASFTNGGGLYNEGTLALNEVTVSDNEAMFFGTGGGIHSADSFPAPTYERIPATLTITRSTISGNQADSGGGIYNASTMTIRESTLSGNEANNFGGGIANFSGTLDVVNSTISGNIVSETSNGGGAIYMRDSAQVRLWNSTIAYNIAGTAQRSGIWQAGGTLTIRNSIVANNSGTNNCLFTGGTQAENGYNIDNGASCGFGGLYGFSTNPQLAPLTNNGGLTQTHALLPGSPAINAGTNAEAVDQTGAALTTDQRGAGFPRINNMTVDIGAFEVIDLGSLNVQATLQGRTQPAPHPSRLITVHVRVVPQGGGSAIFNQDVLTSQASAFTIANLPVGTYLFTFKGTHTLARQATITTGANIYTTLALLEGDANDNNSITLPDFSLLASSFGKAMGDSGYDARADFNGDNQVTLTDFSLLASNYGLTGEGG